MKVQTSIEVNHFCNYINANVSEVTMVVDDYEHDCHVVKVNGERFKIHKDVFDFVKLSCPYMKVSNKTIH